MTYCSINKVQVDVNAPKELRRPKKYVVTPSLLACINWKRIIIE